MTKLPGITSREVIKALLKIGFVEHRSKGSHLIFKRQNARVIVAVHRGKDIKKGTLMAIIKQSGLTVEEFLTLAR